MLSYLLINMASDSETARCSNLATRRNSESDSKDSSSSHSSLSEVLEHTRGQSQSVDIVI